MPTTSIATMMAKYGRVAAVPQLVRDAALALGCVVEFVLIVGDRTVILNASDGEGLKGRQMTQAEHEVLDGSPVASIADSTAVQVVLPDDICAALSVAERIDEAQKLQLGDYASALTASIESSFKPQETDLEMEAAILGGLRDAVFVLDTDLYVRWANRGVVTLLGWGPEEVVGKHFASFIHADDVALALDASSSLTTGHRVYRLNLRVADAYSRWVPVSITGFDHSADPKIGGIVLSVRNNERQLESERVLDETRRISSTILENLYEAVIAVDDVGHITVTNAAARELFEISPELPTAALTVDDFRLLDKENQALDQRSHPLLHSSDWSNQELRVLTTRGIRHLTVNRSEVGLDQDRSGLVVTFHDVTQARSDARELRDRALHDQLTGLPNRRFLAERLQALKAEGQTRLAACFVDIDKFKSVNDIHGHAVGDAVLRETAKRLRDYSRDGDFLARTGGDEFLMIFADPSSESSALIVADRIRRAFELPFKIGGHRLHLTASIGLAFQDGGTFDDERILQHADIALYAAKEGGRDRTELFDDELECSVALERSQKEMVQNAIETGRTEVHYQAVVDMSDRIVGIEALMRCRNASNELVGPADFLDAIGETNLMTRLDKIGFASACRLGAILQSNPETAHIWVASNFSAITLAQPDFADMVLSMTDAAGVSCSTMCIEVTETAAFEPGQTGIESLTRLHQAGIRIALDDFGTGYSSLSHLRDLPLSTVKIDRSFTCQLHKNGAERAIASAVTDIATSLGFSVVAEGVETAAHRDAVSEVGIEMMQGWFFASSMPQDELLVLLGIDQDTPVPASA